MQKLWYNIFNLLRDHVIKRHVTQSLHTISSFPPNLVYMSSFKLWHNNIENWLLKNEIENSYYKVIATCDRSLIKSAPGITKCDRSLLQSASGITKCDRLLLQSVSVVTKCGNYYKVRHNNYKQQTSLMIKFNKVS